MNSKYIVISDRERSRSLEKHTNPKIYINIEKSCYSYEKGDIIGGVYKFIEKIKDGTFGRVILVRDINKGNFYALKVLMCLSRKIIKDSKYDCKIEFDAAKSLFYSSCIHHPGRMHIGRSHTYF
jgi:dual-specificity kinase/CDC-like kinase